MIEDHRIVVVMPAYNAEKTLLDTYSEIPKDIVDEVILVDDFSGDKTVQKAKELDLVLIQHQDNYGYGKNQKTCFDAALERGADIVVILHPDYQYAPQLITPLCHLITHGPFDIALASRILGGKALSGGMPLYKYVANRALTLFQNILLNNKLSEYHTGFRAYTRKALISIPYHENSNDFVFDNQILAQMLFKGFEAGEITCPTKYFPEASSINFYRSVIYGFGCLFTSVLYRLNKLGLTKSRLFREL